MVVKLPAGQQGLGIYGAYGFKISYNIIQDSGGLFLNGQLLTSAFDIDDGSRLYGNLDYVSQGQPTESLLLRSLPRTFNNGVPGLDINAMFRATR